MKYDEIRNRNFDGACSVAGINGLKVYLPEFYQMKFMENKQATTTAPMAVRGLMGKSPLKKPRSWFDGSPVRVAMKPLTSTNPRPPRPPANFASVGSWKAPGRIATNPRVGACERQRATKQEFRIQDAKNGSSAKRVINRNNTCESQLLTTFWIDILTDFKQLRKQDWSKPSCCDSMFRPALFRSDLCSTSKRPFQTPPSPTMAWKAREKRRRARLLQASH